MGSGRQTVDRSQDSEARGLKPEARSLSTPNLRPVQSELDIRAHTESALDMRTTLDIPEDLIEEARKLLGFKSKTDTIVLSLRELVRRKRIEQIREILGSIDLEINLGDSRRRPRRPRSR